MFRRSTYIHSTQEAEARIPLASLSHIVRSSSSVRVLVEYTGSPGFTCGTPLKLQLEYVLRPFLKNKAHINNKKVD